MPGVPRAGRIDVIPFFASLVVTAAVAPFVRHVMQIAGIIDIPNHRSSHIAAVPRGGGLACLGGVLVGLAVAQLQGRHVPWVAVLAIVLLAGVGFADDRVVLGATPRLAAQLASGVIAGAAIGGVSLALVAVVVFPAAVNIVNFMDGINGITSLVMTCWGITTLLVGRAHGLELLSVVGAVSAGSAFGFLPWNTPVAKLFLGDVGSYLFGGLVSIGLLLGWIGGVNKVLLLAPLALYLADTGTTLINRALRGYSLIEAHREHVYQRLVSEAALPHVAVAVTVAVLSGCITATVAFASVPIAVGTSAAIIAGYLLSVPMLRVIRNIFPATGKKMT